MIFSCFRIALRRVAVAGCAMLLAGCAYSLVSGNTINQAKVDQVKEGIQKIRQLSFTKPVPLVIEDRNEAEDQMEADLARDYSDDQLRADGLAGAMLGLYPAGMDLKAESLKLLRNQVAGFYDPRSQQMVMVSGAAELGFLFSAVEFVAQRDAAGEMVLAHELTHALQDQHFDLNKKLDEVKNNDDRGLAFKCVAEGDATIAGLAYVAGTMDAATLDNLLAHLGDISGAFAAEAPGTPEGLSVPLIFQYSDGVRFVAEAYRRGGWKAVDALYGNPPLSTQQIIHPADYFDHPKPPVDVEVHGYDHAMASWKKVDDDTYGELLLRVILQRNLGKDAREVALAQRWSGDQMIILQSGREISVIWMVAFADDASARKFAAAYASILDKLLGTARHEIDYRNDAVLIVVGNGAQDMETMAPAIWAQSKVSGHVEAESEASP
ncbi:MAG TPA: hypothetical protein VJX23_06860 [Candidatus Binataceae bacterium]|nr:hypothetical protein [Candidatus Binataceae bacterium]